MFSSLLALHRVIHKAVPLLLSTFLICACAKQDPLSTLQKDRVQDTLVSAGRVYNAALSNIQSPSQSRESTMNTSDSVLKQMTKTLQDHIKGRDCRLRYSPPDTYSIDNVQGIRRTFVLMKLWGENKYCPINLDFKVSTLLEPSIGRWAISYDYSYSVSDDTYRGLNDIDAIELHGGTSLNGIGTGDVRSETNFKGNLHSQSIGNIDIESFGELKGDDSDSLSGSTTFTFSYSDFSAEFVKSFDNGNTSFTINQEPVDVRGFSRYFSQGGDPFIYFSNTSLIQ